MTIVATARKALVVLVAAASIGAAVAPTSASAKGHFGRNAAFFAGGLAIGAIAAGSAYGSYDRDVAYERDCWIEKRKAYDAYGDVYFRRVRVCD